jgi:hypothetical protein
MTPERHHHKLAPPPKLEEEASTVAHVTPVTTDAQDPLGEFTVLVATVGLDLIEK